MSDTVGSPPYPGATTTTKTLYRQLAETRAWLVEEQANLRPLLKPQHAERMGEPDNLAAETIWEHVSVIDRYTTLSMLRQVRESWDHVLREHGDSWDSKLALKRRYAVLSLASTVLRESFVDPETREARTQRATDLHVKWMRRIQEHLRKALGPFELQEHDDDEAKDPPGEPAGDDDWFTDDVEPA